MKKLSNNLIRSCEIISLNGEYYTTKSRKAHDFTLMRIITGSQQYGKTCLKQSLKKDKIKILMKTVA